MELECNECMSQKCIMKIGFDEMNLGLNLNFGEYVEEILTALNEVELRMT